MRKNTLLNIFLSLSATLFIGGNIFLSRTSENVIKVHASSGSPTYETSLATNINLDKSSSEEIRSYYNVLNSLSDSERTGSNLLKNLRPILQDMTYYSYDNIWKIYEITDREWALSPASLNASFDEASNSFNGYTYGTSTSNGGTNPYVRTLYRNRDSEGVTIEEARIRAWDSHSTDGTNREHIWPQSRGFKASSGAKGPAGTDLHHLRSGDDHVNSGMHNNYPYGYVDKTISYKDGAEKHAYLSGNFFGEALNKTTQDQGTKVFEPQDSDKGDIARAIFYMAACYNNLDGNANITEFNPNLTIIDYIYDANDNSVASTSTSPVGMSKLSDLLEWHRLDPVDEFEIYRNDLIYNNYQHNRNPFIDYPDWVEVVWGNTGKVASPDKDSVHGSAISISDSNLKLNINETKTFVLSATSENASPITWTVSNNDVISLKKTTSASGEEITVNILKAGVATITATVEIDGQAFTSVCNVEIVEEFVIQTWMYIAAGAVVLVILIIVLSSSSKARKKAKKAVKKKIKSKKK